MHTVVETHAFRRQAAAAGMTEQEIEGLISDLASNPSAGVAVRGTGGCRKVRVAGRGKGKSGGYRTITFYTGQDIPVFLVTVFSTGVRDNLSQKERNAIAAVAKDIAAEYSARVVKARARG